MKLQAIPILIFCLVAPAAASAQQTPPLPAGVGTSLPATMQFIQDKLNGIGERDFTEFRRKLHYGGPDSVGIGTVGRMEEVTRVVANPATCRLAWHWRSEKDGYPDQNANRSLALRDVEKVDVKAWKEYQTDVYAGLDESDIVATRTDPEMMALVVQGPSGAIYAFPFPTENLNAARQVAQVLTQAVKLCGGQLLPPG